MHWNCCRSKSSIFSTNKYQLQQPKYASQSRVKCIPWEKHLKSNRHPETTSKKTQLIGTFVHALPKCRLTISRSHFLASTNINRNATNLQCGDDQPQASSFSKRAFKLFDTEGLSRASTDVCSLIWLGRPAPSLVYRRSGYGPSWTMDMWVTPDSGPARGPHLGPASQKPQSAHSHVLQTGNLLWAPSAKYWYRRARKDLV